MKRFIFFTLTFLFSIINYAQCDLEVSFEYELIDGTWHFTNTSVGEDDASVYQWSVDGLIWSDDENPTLGMGDTEDGSEICFAIWDEETECEGESCVALEFDEEPCDLEGSFEYVIEDGTIYFTNTSTGEGDASVYNWYVDDFLWSDDENPTLGLGDVEEGSIICFVIWDEETECEDEVCEEIDLDAEPCDLEGSFEYVIEDGVIYFTNTSTGEGDASVYNWYVDDFLWSDDENPTLGLGDVEEGSIICFVVWDEETECEDEVCEEIDLDAEPCDLEGSFEYVIEDGVIYFTNTSTGEGDASVYNWYVDDFLWSDDENPTLGLGDVEEGSIICFVIWDEETECEDEVCEEIDLDAEPCDLEGSFEYVILDDLIYFTNTSTGEDGESAFAWYVDDVLWSDDENPTLGLGDVEPGSIICFVIWDEVTECEDEVCIEIELTEPCEEFEVDFTMEVIAAEVHFADASIDAPSDPIYSWYDDGVLFSELAAPNVPLAEIEAESNICLLISSEAESCEASHCKPFYTETELSIDQNDLAQINVYPNPTHGQIRITTTTTHNDIGSVEVYNAIGERILSENNTDNSGTAIQIDLHDLENGIYLISVKDKNGITLATERIIKN